MLVSTPFIVKTPLTSDDTVTEPEPIILVDEPMDAPPCTMFKKVFVLLVATLVVPAAVVEITKAVFFAVNKESEALIPYPLNVVGLLAKLANGIAISAVPSKLTPAMVLAVWSLVAVSAFPAEVALPKKELAVTLAGNVTFFS